MEDRRAVAGAALMLALLLWLAGPANPVGAYDNAVAHPTINRAAVTRLVERMKIDPSLKSASLDGEASLGMEVAELGMLKIGEKEATKSVADWISHGGLSADEPELYMSFRHFYDPFSVGGVPWLTDHLDDLLSFSPVPIGKNPEVSARQWAISHPDNKYNWQQAKAYFASAMKDTETQPGKVFDYGRAWRAVGETMHLVADMTVPAHVRNDGHPYLEVRSLKLGDPDPYESTTFAAEVSEYLDNDPSPSINYKEKDIDKLLHQVAAWTNHNFFSEHTIPRWWGNGKTANGQPEYPAPKMPDEPEGNYYFQEVDGTTTLLARKSVLSSLGLIRNGGAVPYGTIDTKVIRAQRSKLVPTAVQACSSVLDAFLPRFKVVIDKIEKDPFGGPNGWDVQGRLEHNSTPLWPDQPTVRNGAFITINGGKPVYIKNGEGILTNSVKFAKIQAKEGDSVVLGYDLGGYKIVSDPLKIGGLTIEPASATVKLGGTVQFKALEGGAAANKVAWKIDGDGQQTGSISQTGLYTAPQKPGTYKVVVLSIADTKLTASAEVKVLPETLALNPASITLPPGGKLTFSATLAGKPAPVNWKIQEGALGGYIVSSGAYTAPTTPGTYHVVATYQSDTTNTATAVVTIAASTPTPTPAPLVLKPQGMVSLGVSIKGKMTLKDTKQPMTGRFVVTETTEPRELALGFVSATGGQNPQPMVTWSGNSFTATRTSTSGGDSMTQTLSGEVDAEGRRILRLAVTDDYKSPSHTYEYKIKWEIRDIPFVRQEADLFTKCLVFELAGGQAGSRVSGFSYLHREWKTDMSGKEMPDDNFRRELLSSDFGDAQSRITVRIYSGSGGNNQLPGYNTIIGWPK